MISNASRPSAPRGGERFGVGSRVAILLLGVALATPAMGADVNLGDARVELARLSPPSTDTACAGHWGSPGEGTAETTILQAPVPPGVEHLEDGAGVARAVRENAVHPAYEFLNPTIRMAYREAHPVLPAVTVPTGPVLGHDVPASADDAGVADWLQIAIAFISLVVEVAPYFAPGDSDLDEFIPESPWYVTCDSGFTTAATCAGSTLLVEPRECMLQYLDTTRQTNQNTDAEYQDHSAASCRYNELPDPGSPNPPGSGLGEPSCEFTLYTPLDGLAPSVDGTGVMRPHQRTLANTVNVCTGASEKLPRVVNRAHGDGQDVVVPNLKVVQKAATPETNPCRTVSVAWPPFEWASDRYYGVPVRCGTAHELAVGYWWLVWDPNNKDGLGVYAICPGEAALRNVSEIDADD